MAARSRCNKFLDATCIPWTAGWTPIRALAWQTFLTPRQQSSTYTTHTAYNWREASKRSYVSCTPLLHQQDAHSQLKDRDAAAATPAEDKTAKRKAGLSSTATSLRRVAVEAQRARYGFIRGRGKRRFVDPNAETKDVTASCAAEQYDIPRVKRLLMQEGYTIDPYRTDLYPQVIHVQTQSANGEGNEGAGDVFVFPSGSVVCWNVPEQLQKQIIQQVLLPAAENPHSGELELEDLEYLEDSTRTNSEIIGDTIILGTATTTSASTTNEQSTNAPESDTDAVLTKIAFSSGLARSTKLAVLENALSSYFTSTRSIPTILSGGSPLRFTRSFILRKTGQLLSIRAQLNLYSELTDSLPDLFWDSPSSLGLSDYYDEVGRALDVNVRIRTLNEKMDYAAEIATVLRERLSEKHSTGLEWLIIFLISIEVGFELRRILREGSETIDRSVEAPM